MLKTHKFLIKQCGFCPSFALETFAITIEFSKKSDPRNGAAQKNAKDENLKNPIPKDFRYIPKDHVCPFLGELGHFPGPCFKKL